MKYTGNDSFSKGKTNWTGVVVGIRMGGSWGRFTIIPIVCVLRETQFYYSIVGGFRIPGLYWVWEVSPSSVSICPAVRMT